jgi:hypothetical protein
VKLTAYRRKIPFLALLVALWACGDDGGGDWDGLAAISTLAYVVTECSEGPGQGYTHRQRLLIRQGEGHPVTVAEVGPVGPLPSRRGLCEWWRWGPFSVVGGAFHRLGVSPDGSVVVFEVTDDFSYATRDQVRPDQEGIFVVRADGSGLRRIGPASRNPSFRVNFPGAAEVDWLFHFDADGSRIAFTDIGPGPSGDTVQIFTMDLATGERHQVTRLPPARVVERGRVSTGYLSFLDDDTIAFSSYSNPVIDGEELNPENQPRSFSVKTTVTANDPDNPTRLRVVPFFAEPGNTRSIIEAFQITGPEPAARILWVEGKPVDGPGFFGDVTLELFVLDSARVLQLTDFHSCCTQASEMSADRQRIFFVARADPLGTNPCNARNIFSIDSTGADLRQLTRRMEGEPSREECDLALGCGIPSDRIHQDPVTRSLVFASNCDPFGTNPNPGGQIFAMHPDGTGLRQLTHSRGRIDLSDGSVTKENHGQWASAVLPW